METYYKKFNTNNDYNNFKWSRQFSSTVNNVSYISDNSTVKYNRLPNNNINLFDILYCNSAGELYVSDEILPTSSNKFPIGLCVIPSGFLFPHSNARFISLKYMNNGNNLYWGQYNVNVTQSYKSHWVDNNYAKRLCSDKLLYNEYTHTFNWNLIDNVGYSNFYSDQSYYKWADSPFYPIDLRKQDGWNNVYYTNILSIYNSNGRWNIPSSPRAYLYYGTDENGYNYTTNKESNVLGDIDGKYNTYKLLLAYTGNDYIIKSIENSSNSGYSPSAGYCWKYGFGNNDKYKWYLGSGGEMAFVLTNIGQIRQKLYSINQIYPDYCFSNLSGKLWTSSEYSATQAFMINLQSSDYCDTLDPVNKDTEAKAIAMIQY